MNAITAAPAGQVSQAPASNLALFKASTRRNRQPLTDQSFNANSQYVRVDVQQVGYAAMYVVQVYGKITTGTSAAGNWSAFFPGNLLQTLAYRSNEGTEVYRTSGWGNFLVQSVLNPAYCPLQNVSGCNPGTTWATNKGMQTAVFAGPTPASALGSSTTYNIMLTHLIPIAADERLSAGLLLLQNQSTRAQIEMSTNALVGNGGNNGWGNATINLGVGATIALTGRISTEFFGVPTNGATPDQNFMHRWIEEEVSWVASGDFIYKVPVNGIISRVIAGVENNGAQQPWFSTGGDPTTQNGTNYQTTYAASQAPEVEDIKIGLWRNRWNYSSDLPDGVFVYEYSRGAGGVELGWDGRDVYDTAYLTELALKLNLAVTPTTGKIKFIREELQRRVS